MSTEIDGQQVWEAIKKELISTYGGDARTSSAKRTAVKRMPSSVLTPHQNKVVNYQSVRETRDAVVWYMIWAVPSEDFSFWKKLRLWYDQIKFSAGCMLSRLDPREYSRMEPKMERELFSRYLSERMFARYEEGNLTIGELVLSEPSLFFGD